MKTIKNEKQQKNEINLKKKKKKIEKQTLCHLSFLLFNLQRCRERQHLLSRDIRFVFVVVVVLCRRCRLVCRIQDTVSRFYHVSSLSFHQLCLLVSHCVPHHRRRRDTVQEDTLCVNRFTFEKLVQAFRY